MEEEKKTIKEKWQDKKYQAKVKLSGYGIFIVIIILMLVIGGTSSNNNSEYEIDNTNNNINNNVNENDNITSDVLFNKPNTDNYTYEIKIITKKDNQVNEYYYYGKAKDNYEQLTKKDGEIEYNYKIVDSKYYVLNNENYILTTKDNVYDIIDYSYLDVDNINNYLSYSKHTNNEYRVFLNDIILNNSSFDYITFTLTDNSININYTNLINNLNNEEYDSYLVNIKYIY